MSQQPPRFVLARAYRQLGRKALRHAGRIGMRMARRVNIASLTLTLLTETVLSVNGSNSVRSAFDDWPAGLGAAKTEEPTTLATNPTTNTTIITFLHFIVCLLA